MKTTWGKNLFHALLLIALIAFAFWFALKDDMDTVLKQVTHVSLFWLFIVLVMGILYYVLQGVMLYFIARKYHEEITLWDGIMNAYAGAFFNGVTPLGGGQIAQTYAFHKLGIAYSHIASILWKDFFLYQCVVVLFAACLLLFSMPYTFSMFPTIIWLVYVGLGIDASVIVILWTMSHFPKVYARLSNVVIHLANKVHLIKNVALTQAKWNAQIAYFASEVASLKQDKLLVLSGILINFLRQIIYYSIPYFVGIGIGLPLSFFDLFMVWLLSCCIHMMNALTPLPGDTGWTESVFIVLFGLVFDRVYASSIMILWRSATYYVPILLGGCSFFIIKTRKKGYVQVEKKAEMHDSTTETDIS